VEGGSVRHRARVVSPQYNPSFPAYTGTPPLILDIRTVCLCCFFTGTSTTCRSRPEHAPTVPPRSQSVSCPRPRSSNAAPQARARAPRASAIACASNARRRPIRYSAPRRTRRACPSLRLLGSKRGWRSMRSRDVPRDCSLRAGNRDANELVAAAVRAKEWATIGACIARSQTSGWKSEQKVAGGSTSFARLSPTS